MADFNFYLNRQGVRGVQGVKGDDGFSPIITVAQDNADGYKLHIQTATDDFDTSNLRPPITNAGGKYLLWDNTTGTMTAGFLDYASTEVVGGVNLATAEDMTEGENTQVVPPVRVVADYIAGKLEENNGTISSTITQTIYQNINTASDDSNVVITKNTGSDPADITDITIGLNNNLANISQLKGKYNENTISIDEPTRISFEALDDGGTPILQIASLDAIINRSQGAMFQLQSGGKVISGMGSGGTAYRYAIGAPAVWVTYPSDTRTHFLLDESALANGGGLNITNNNTTQKMSLEGIPEQDTIRPTVTIGVNVDNNTIKINEQGQLYADVQTGEVPVATTSTAGIVKPDGTTITITSDGTITAVGGGTGGGDVTAAGDNTFSGSNTFGGNTTFTAPSIFNSTTIFNSTSNFDQRVYVTAPLTIEASTYTSQGIRFYANNLSSSRYVDARTDGTMFKLSTSGNDVGIQLAVDNSSKLTLDSTVSITSGDESVTLANSEGNFLALGEDTLYYHKKDNSNIDLLNPTVDLSEINSQISAMQADIAAIEQQMGNIVTRLNEINGEDI